eukprot:Colp12_sorted_trinity150504_noHs@6387
MCGNLVHKSLPVLSGCLLRSGLHGSFDIALGAGEPDLEGVVAVAVVVVAALTAARLGLVLAGDHLPVQPGHASVVEDLHLVVELPGGVLRDAPLLDHQVLALRGGLLLELGDEVGPLGGLVHVAVHREDVDRAAVQRLVDDVELVVAAVFRTADTTGGDLHARALDDVFHVARAAADPVVGVILLELVHRVDHRFVLDVESQDDLAQLGPRLLEVGRLVVEDVSDAFVVVALGSVVAVEVVRVVVLVAVRIAPVGASQTATVVRRDNCLDTLLVQKRQDVVESVQDVIVVSADRARIFQALHPLGLASLYATSSRSNHPQSHDLGAPSGKRVHPIVLLGRGSSVDKIVVSSTKGGRIGTCPN